MSALNERWEFARTVAQGLAAVLTAGKVVAETVKGLAKRKAERTALADRLGAVESENVRLTALVNALRQDLARESVSREREARAHKTLAARTRAEKDDGGEEVEISNVTYLRGNDEPGR